MASLTVRQLDEKLKRLLRLRAAKSGRSVEDEVRTILREATEETGTAALELIEPPSPPAKGRATVSRPIVPGGHQTRPADHRRRHRRLQVTRSHSSAEGARHCGALHSDESR